jgi:hypothetical protein
MNEIKVGDLFIMEDLEVIDNNVNFDLTILPAGEDFIKEEKAKDKDWTLEKYFTDIVTAALSNYVKNNKKPD